MPTRKTTRTPSVKIASELRTRVPTRKPSHIVATAVAWKLKDREQLLARAAKVANHSRAVRNIEREFDSLQD